MKKYKVTLTGEEREKLHTLVTKGKAAANKLTHARILLKADQGKDGPACTDTEIAEAVEVSLATIERVRQRFVEQGLQAALDRKKQSHPSRPRKLDGQAEAYLIALACSEAPDGRQEWTMQLLADKLVELEIVDSICDETVRRTLKKRDQAVVKRAMVYPTQRQRGICGGDGGRFEGLPPALRPQVSASVPR